MQVYNKTPFQAERIVSQDRDGRDVLVTILKATYSFDEEGQLRIADEQLPVQMEDTFHGEPDSSSTLLESDLAPFKPATDIVLIGHAYAPDTSSTSVEVSLRVGRAELRCVVYGTRRWTRSLMGMRPSSPEPFERIPLIYENAFGGQDLSAKKESHHAWEERNPVGCGLISKRSRLDRAESRVPHIEDPSQPIGNGRRRPTPVGFGFIGRSWTPRRRFAGTYDEQWERERAPLLPRDFDERYHNGAHPALVYDGYLNGDEAVEIRGATPRGHCAFHLPDIEVGMRTVTRDVVRTDLEPHLDTLVIEPDEGRLSLVWRASQSIHGRLKELAMIRFVADV